MEEPLVSAVIPVYNGERFLRESLESVFAQTYPSLEVVVVDDGSTDGSAALIDSYGTRLIAVHQENQGVGGARNTGMTRAGGRFVAFCDQDDRWRPKKIEKQVALFLADDALGLVHTDVLHYDEAKSVFAGPLDPAAEPHRLAGDCYQRLLLDNQIYNSSVMVRASVLEEVGLCDPEIRGNTVQDYDLWLRIARRSRFAFLDEPLTVFRVHSDQGTWDRRLMLTEESRLLERVLAEDRAAVSDEMRLRMAGLYDALGTAHVDAGERGLARRNFARSLKWRRTRRAALLWAVCLLPAPVIRRLQAARAGRRAGSDEGQTGRPEGTAQ